jgi:hypothetical protein
MMVEFTVACGAPTGVFDLARRIAPEQYTLVASYRPLGAYWVGAAPSVLLSSKPALVGLFAGS